MKIRSVSSNNYRPFSILDEVKTGSLTTIMGRNDSGKSSVLKILDVFFNKETLVDVDVHYGADDKEDVIIEVSFDSLPNIKIEPNIETTFREEMLVDSENYLRILKRYPRNNLKKFEVSLIVQDFEEDKYAELLNLTDAKLNTLYASLGIDNSSEEVTNKIKRKKIREKAELAGISLTQREFEVNKKLWNMIEKILPNFSLFETDTKLGINETSFQNEFNQIIRDSSNSSGNMFAKLTFAGNIERSLQSEVDKIFERFKKYTDDFVSLRLNLNLIGIKP